MNLKVTRLEDGKTETTRVPLGLQIEWQEYESSVERIAYGAWRMWHEAGWTSTPDYKTFSWEIDVDIVGDDIDPKARS